MSSDTFFQIPARAPEWFVDNLQSPGESKFIPVLLAGQENQIHCLGWNLEQQELPTLILTHGFAGHANWWSFLVPFLADRYRVVVIDLPGMGDSDHLPEYIDDCFAQAIIGVVESISRQPVTIAGHSFGGFQTMFAMALRPELFRHGIIIDSNLNFVADSNKWDNRDPARPHALRGSRSECMARFQPTPPQPEMIPAVLQFIAHHSCRELEGGWCWKFDPNMRNFGGIKNPQLLERIPGHIDCLYGSRSIYNTDRLTDNAHQRFPELGRLKLVPKAFHHLMLDHPLELIEAMNELLDSAR